MASELSHLSFRTCGRCGSRRIAMRVIAADYHRKECADCGSPGPFLSPGSAPKAALTPEEPTPSSTEAKETAA